jgi:hypothetical protein
MQMIAETYILDKAPHLSDYMLGFQLLKKNDDDTKAAGIFAYKVGEELVYIPVFAINGDIQGHELMYLVSKDQFVPSDEKWVNYLLSRKPQEPGVPEGRNRGDIPSYGVLRPSFMDSGLKLGSAEKVLPPELTLYALKTLFKQASVGTPALERAFWTPAKQTRRIPAWNWKQAACIDLDVRRLFERSYKAVKIAETLSREYPVFGRLLRFAMDGEGLENYKAEWEKRASLAEKLGVVPRSPRTLQQRLEARIPRPVPQRAKTGSVRVYDLEEIPEVQFRFLPEETIDRIHRDGYYAADSRDQSKLAALLTDMGTEQEKLRVVKKENRDRRDLWNPVEPGLYKVFTSDGTFRDCFILERSLLTSSSGGGCGISLSEPGKDIWLVLDKKTRETLHAPSHRIFVASRDPDPEWLDKLPDSNAGLPAENGYDRYRDIKVLLVTPYGIVLTGCYEKNREGSFTEYYTGETVRPVSESLRGFRGLGTQGRVILAPKKTKLRRYKENPESSRLQPGTYSLWLDLLARHSLPVVVQKNPGAVGQYTIDALPGLWTKRAALETLMTRHHLPQDSAEEMLKTAEAECPVPVTFRRTKTADFDYSEDAEQKRYKVHFPENQKGVHDVTGMPIRQNLETSEIVDGLQATGELSEKDLWPGLPSAETDQSGAPPAPDPEAMSLASQAARSGQKEFVSSQMLLSLLREIDDDSIIVKYITVFEKACDTLGRLYMQVLWRSDFFEERFGMTQLREFKEMLVSLFQQTGDFICYLRQRDVRPSPTLALSAADTESEE